MSDKQRVKTVSFFTAGVITTMSITLALFLLGLVCLLGLTGKRFSDHFKENMTLSVGISDKMSDAEQAKLKSALEKNKYVKSVDYIGKEQIKEYLIKDLGQDPTEVLDYDPSRSYFDIHIKSEYVNPDSIRLVAASLKGIQLAKNITYNEEDIYQADANLSKLGSVLSILALVLILISFTLIRNTIQLNIYSQRFLINTMQLVGATNSFIRKPFILRMMVSGIVAAAIAAVFITGVALYVVREYPEAAEIVQKEELIAVYVIVLIFGILLSTLATLSAVNRFLRMKTNKLYYI
ncbi:ABC transporter permease [Dysgonomonas sp. 25]|uniref:cell division protein FtsX n=1 Tax=Dysgonomonas sp. 25 TaxID=2302933 RepID=UPI0013D4715F|nr:permease-like cell division protein FtsX [Dysgonomonas sp. 25]NDV68275.1 cell division protein FtsX [Dysgonomonas sp. 25]